MPTSTTTDGLRIWIEGSMDGVYHQLNGEERMSLGRSRFGLPLTALLLFLAASPAVGQRLCDYEQCSLRLSHTPLQLLRGERGEPLGRTFVGPKLDVLTDAGGEVAELAERFRRYRYGTWAVRVATIARFVATHRAFESDRESMYLSALLITGVSILAQRFLDGRGLDHLERAVWLYNGRLRQGPDSPEPSAHRDEPLLPRPTRGSARVYARCTKPGPRRWAPVAACGIAQEPGGDHPGQR
ncbi:MAG TPA: hypothetical protein VF158_07645 [Longimicrobiales bacterium]